MSSRLLFGNIVVTLSSHTMLLLEQESFGRYRAGDLVTTIQQR